MALDLKGPPGFRGQHLLPSHAADGSFFLFFFSGLLLCSSALLWVISSWTSPGPVPCFCGPVPPLLQLHLPSLLYVFRHYHLSPLVFLASPCFRTFLSSLGSILGPALIRRSGFISCSALRLSSSYLCFLSKPSLTDSQSTDTLLFCCDVRLTNDKISFQEILRASESV